MIYRFISADDMKNADVRYNKIRNGFSHTFDELIVLAHMFVFLCNPFNIEMVVTDTQIYYYRYFQHINANDEARTNMKIQ